MLNKLFSHIPVYYIFVLILGFLSIPVHAQNSNVDFFSPQNRLNFGDRLFCEHDYLRAINEYSAYLQKESNDTIRFKMGFALSEMGRISESQDYYKGLFYNSTLQDEARLQYFKILFQSNDFELFRETVNSGNYNSDSINPVLNKLYAVSYLKGENRIDSLGFLKAFEESEKEVMLNFFNRKKNPGFKSPTRAAVLSALLPGLGKVYSDEVGDGITSFIFSGVLGFLAYNNFKNDHPIRAWVFTGLTAYFYAGNVYGSMAAAQNYNAAVNFRLDGDLNTYLNSKNYFSPVYKFLCK